MLRFVFPTESSRQDVQSFYNEFKSDGGTCIGYGGYKNFAHWLAGMNNRISGKNLPARICPREFLSLLRRRRHSRRIQPQVRADRVPAELRRAHRTCGQAVAQEQWLRLADAREGARHRPRTRIRARAVCLRRGQHRLGARDNKKRRNIREQAVRR